MGFDMYFVTTPDGQAEADEVETSYFRLNIFGMGRYREAMAKLGMAFDAGDRPAWPDAEDHGTTHEDAWAAECPEDDPEGFKALTPERLEKANAFLSAQRDVLGWHGDADIPGIPLHKFSTNDGWIVQPAECEAAVQVWEKFAAEWGEAAVQGFLSRRGIDADYWRRWIEYLRSAARHGGFEVH